MKKNDKQPKGGIGQEAVIAALNEELQELENLSPKSMESVVGGVGPGISGLGPVQMTMDGMGPETFSTKRLGAVTITKVTDCGGLVDTQHVTQTETKSEYVDNLETCVLDALNTSFDEKVDVQARELALMSKEAAAHGTTFDLQGAEAQLHKADVAQYDAAVSTIGKDFAELSESLAPGMRLTRDGEAQFINAMTNQIDGQGLGAQADHVLNKFSENGLLSNGQTFHEGAPGHGPSITGTLNEMGEILEQSSESKAVTDAIDAARLQEKLESDPALAVAMDIPLGPNGQWTTAEIDVMENNPELADQDHVKIEYSGGAFGEWVDKHEAAVFAVEGGVLAAAALVGGVVAGIAGGGAVAGAEGAASASVAAADAEGAGVAGEAASAATADSSSLNAVSTQGALQQSEQASWSMVESGSEAEGPDLPGLTARNLGGDLGKMGTKNLETGVWNLDTIEANPQGAEGDANWSDTWSARNMTDMRLSDGEND